MSSERDDFTRASAQRFLAARASFATWLRSLLGAHARIVPVEDVRAAASLYGEYRAGEREAEGQDWALARHSWPLQDIDEAVDALHRLSNNLGSRDVWLIIPDRDPQACALSSEMVLDNPLGFAALARNELALMDRAVPAGLSFQRHDVTNEYGSEHEWELIVWGEPWLSATTRALRGIG